MGAELVAGDSSRIFESAFSAVDTVSGTFFSGSLFSSFTSSTSFDRIDTGMNCPARTNSVALLSLSRGWVLEEFLSEGFSSDTGSTDFVSASESCGCEVAGSETGSDVVDSELFVSGLFTGGSSERSGAFGFARNIVVLFFS